MTNDLDALIAQSADNDGQKKEYAPNWDHRKDDHPNMIAGTITGIGHTVTANGDARFLTVHDRATDQEWTIWCSSRMLEDFVITEAPKVGALVVIEFKGKQPTKNDPSRSYNVWSTVLEDGGSDYEAWQKVDQAFQAKASASANTAQVQSFGPEEAPF